MRLLISILLCVCGSVHAATFATVAPLALAWRSNIVAVQASTVNYPGHAWTVNQWAKELIYSGVLAKTYYVNPRAGDDLTASLMTLKHPTAEHGVAETNSGSFVAGDYTVTTGLTGNGTSKYLTLGVNPRSLGVSTNSVFIGCSVLSAQTLGTTRIYFGGAGAASSDTIFLGLVNGGTQETTLMGTVNGTVAQYAGGTTNSSQSGFLNGNILSPGFFVANSAMTTNTPGGQGSGAQGIAHDGTHGFVLRTAQIIKYQLSDNVTVLTNNSPFTGLGGTNIGHLGDGYCRSGKLVVACHSETDAGGVVSNASFLVYNTTTLALEAAYLVTNVTDILGGACIGQDDLVYAHYGSGCSNIYVFNPDTFAHVRTIKIDNLFAVPQGIEMTNGFLFVAEGGSANPADLDIYCVNPTNGQTQLIYRISGGISEAEGLMLHGTNLVVNTIESTLSKLRWLPLSTNYSAAARGIVFRNGSQQLGRWAYTTAGLPNNHMFFSSVNNNGTPGSYDTRRLGSSILAQGLTVEEIYATSQAFIRLDRNLGRR